MCGRGFWEARGLKGPGTALLSADDTWNGDTWGEAHHLSPEEAMQATVFKLFACAAVLKLSTVLAFVTQASCK